jgi:hypothetical protein
MESQEYKFIISPENIKSDLVFVTYTGETDITTIIDPCCLTATTISATTTGTTGVYYVNYKATNANGSATAKRKVNVIIGKDNWLVNWSVTSNCGTTSFPLAGSPTVTSGSNANELVIDNMFTLVGGTAYATITGANIAMPEQTIPVTGGEVTFTGNGTMTATGNIININYTYLNTIPLIGGSGECVATYTKQ